MVATENSTVGDIVRGDFRAAAVFHDFGIDFCCGGGKSLRDACDARNLRPDAVVEELNRACAASDSTAVNTTVPIVSRAAVSVTVRRVITDHDPGRRQPRASSNTTGKPSPPTMTATATDMLTTGSAAYAIRLSELSEKPALLNAEIAWNTP